MKTLTIRINERTKSGRTLMDLLEIFSKDKKGVEILEDPYDPKFVAKIKSREEGLKSKKLVKVNPDDLWGSIQ